MTIPHHEKDKPTFREVFKEALLFLLRRQDVVAVGEGEAAMGPAAG